MPSTTTTTLASCGNTSITESASQEIVSGNSVSCNNGVGHADNSYWRAFNLSGFGISDTFNVCQVEIGIEQATSSGGSQPVTVRLYTSSQTFPQGYPGSLTLIGSASNVSVADQSLTVLTIPVTGVAPVGSQLVVEIFTPNGY